MDVAVVEQDGQPTLLTISQYLALSASERPSHLRCAGMADSRRCGAAVFPKAIRGGLIAPHFASLHHLDGCDHATRPHSSRLHSDRALDPSPEPLRLTAIPGATNTCAPSNPALTGARSAAPRASLRTVLRVLTGHGLPPELRVQWHQNPPLLAYEFFIHLASATTPQEQPRGYWGQIHHVHRHQQTRSVHLVPRQGPPIVIGAGTCDEVVPPSPAALTGAAILAVGPLRRSRSGALYVLVRQPSVVVWL